MKTLVVDTNIIFNALISANSRAAMFLLEPPTSVRLVSCHFLQIELFKHKERIQQLSGLGDEALLELLYELMSHIEFINEAYIPFACWQRAHQLLAEIDPNDVPFLALGIHLNAQLWTGDRRMIDGLLARGYIELITTRQLLDE
jgi:predicted nucleic acid-binding protein